MSKELSAAKNEIETGRQQITLLEKVGAESAEKIDQLQNKIKELEGAHPDPVRRRRRKAARARGFDADGPVQVSQMEIDSYLQQIQTLDSYCKNVEQYCNQLQSLVGDPCPYCGQQRPLLSVRQ